MIRLRSIDLVGIGSILSLPAAAYWLAIAPAFRENTAAVAMADELVQQRTIQESMERSLTQMKASTLDAATTRPALKLLPASELNRRLTDLNDLAVNDALQIDSLAPGEAVAHDRYTTIPITLSAQGSYRSCQRWLSELKTAAPDLAVNQLEIVSNATDKSGSVRVAALLQWYASPTPAKK